MANVELLGADTSLLIAHSLEDHPDHEKVSKLVAEVLAHGNLLALCPVVIDEFIHVITDARRFEHPLEMACAISLARTWSQSKETMVVLPTEKSLTLQLDWMQRHRLGRKRLHDTQIAAIYHLVGVETILSSNWRDFTIFDCFKIQSW